jgi:phosphoribosylglycinamide formyltransferase-1
VKKIVILISGRGSNMVSLLDANLPCTVAAVISNRADAGGLAIAQARGIATAVISHRDYADRETFDEALAKLIDAYAPDFVILAGFMRILSTPFVEHYRGRLINIHPSLLPAFTGVHTHQRAIDEGVKIHGCTVHFVTPTLDAGPIIIQAVVSVLPDDTEHSLSTRVLREEHRIYPQAVNWLCQQKVWLNEAGRVVNQALTFAETALISPCLD